MLLRLTAALAIAASVAPTNALWSMYCSRDGIVTERIDRPSPLSPFPLLTLLIPFSDREPRSDLDAFPHRVRWKRL